MELDGADQVPLDAVPLLLQIIGQPDHEERDETLAILCDLVSSCYDEDGDAIGSIIRESGGLLTLSWLLAEEDLVVVKQALFLIANLASDSVDPRAYLSKRLLRQCGCEYRLLPGLDSDDAEVVAYTCGALQNLCNDPEWSQVLLDQGVVIRLEVQDDPLRLGRLGRLRRLRRSAHLPPSTCAHPPSSLHPLSHASRSPCRFSSQELVEHSDALVQRYSAGALKNLLATLAEAGFDTGSDGPKIVSDKALDKVHERGKWAAVANITERNAARRIQKKVPSALEASALEAACRVPRALEATCRVPWRPRASRWPWAPLPPRAHHA